MTLKLAKRLLARQVGKISLKSLEKVFLARRVNPRLVETILLNNINERVLDKVRDYLVKCVIAKDKRALNVLFRASDERLNKNAESRYCAVDGLRNLAENGELSALPGLLRIVNDSSASVRLHAVAGLRTLALKGELKVLPGLLKVLKDSDWGVRLHAVDGLWKLASRDELKVLPGLLKAVNDSDAGVRQHAVGGLQSLAKLGNKQAQKKLIQLKQNW